MKTCSMINNATCKTLDMSGGQVATASSPFTNATPHYFTTLLTRSPSVTTDPSLDSNLPQSFAISAIRLRPRNMAPLLPMASASGPSSMFQDDTFLPRSDRGLPIMLRRLTKFKTMVSAAVGGVMIVGCERREV